MVAMYDTYTLIGFQDSSKSPPWFEFTVHMEPPLRYVPVPSRPQLGLQDDLLALDVHRYASEITSVGAARINYRFGW